MKKPKKYVCIAKVGTNPNKSAHCVKYRSSNLISFTVFLDRKFPHWTWFNVFSKESGKQIASFTKYNRPKGKDA